MSFPETFASDHMRASLAVMERAAASESLRGAMVAAAEAIAASVRAGGKLLVAGNGGSAGDAQHFAGEFLSRLNFDRAPLPALALTTDSSVMTAVGNDYGFDHVFERQILGLGRAGDVLVAISTSGRSPNILRALEAARRTGLVTIGLTGDQGAMDTICDVVVAAPSDRTPLIQQIHIVAAHVICGLVEATLCGPGADAR